MRVAAEIVLLKKERRKLQEMAFDTQHLSTPARACTYCSAGSRGHDDQGHCRETGGRRDTRSGAGTLALPKRERRRWRSNARVRRTTAARTPRGRRSCVARSSRRRRRRHPLVVPVDGTATGHHAQLQEMAFDTQHLSTPARACTYCSAGSRGHDDQGHCRETGGRRDTRSGAGTLALPKRERRRWRSNARVRRTTAARTPRGRRSCVARSSRRRRRRHPLVVPVDGTATGHPRV